MTKKELLTLAMQYTEALADNAPQNLPVSANCKSTYSGTQQPLGSGEVWGVPRRIPYRQTFADPVTKTVCFSGVVTNHINSSAVSADVKPLVFVPQRWWIYFVRLTVNDDGQICEIEEIARQETGAMLTTMPSQMEPPLILQTPISEDDRSSREEMIRIASLYWDGAQKLIPASEVPFHPDAFRVEVGTRFNDTYNMPSSIRAQHAHPELYWAVVKRRYPIVDVNTGIVVSMVHMVGSTPREPTGYVTDIFKIECGMIKCVYAFHDWLIDFVDWDGIGPQTTAEMD